MTTPLYGHHSKRWEYFMNYPSLPNCIWERIDFLYCPIPGTQCTNIPFITVFSIKSGNFIYGVVCFGKFEREDWGVFYTR